MFYGSTVALVTPFHENLEIDFDSLIELIEWHLEEGTDQISVCGTTGENGSMSEEEFSAVVETAVKTVRKRVPVIAGSGCLDTRLSIKQTIEAKRLGADAALMIVPYYIRPTDEGCIAHFQEVAKAKLPMIVYHHPGRTGIKLSPQTLAKICEIPEVAAVKDAAADLSHSLELKCLTNTPIISGDDVIALPHLAIGHIGVVSIIANILPRKWKEFIVAMRSNCLEDGKKLFSEMYNLARALVIETNPQCVKFALSKMGKCKPYLRLPLVQPRPSTREVIEAELVKYQFDSCIKL